MLEHQALQDMTHNLFYLAEKMDALKLSLAGTETIGAHALIVEMDRSLHETISQFCRQEYELHQTVDGWMALQYELDLAHHVQRALFPMEPLAYQEICVAGATRPARLLGGDYYLHRVTAEGLYAAIGDVSGKGVANSLITVIIDNQLKQLTGQNMPLENVLIALNRHFSSIMGQYAALEKKFMTFLLMRYQQGWVEFAGAGHEHILHYRAGHKTVQKIKTGGVALGMITDFLGIYSSSRIELQPGDCLLTYSDGVTEAHSRPDEMYSLERLMSIFCRNAYLNPDQLIDRIFADVLRFQSASEAHDDMTLLAFKRAC